MREEQELLMDAEKRACIICAAEAFTYFTYELLLPPPSPPLRFSFGGTLPYDTMSVGISNTPGARRVATA